VASATPSLQERRAGEITVSLDNVKSLRASGSFAVLGKNAPISRKAVTPGTVQYSDKKLTVTTPQGAVETLPEDHIAYIIDQPTYHRELEKKPGLLYDGTAPSTAAPPSCLHRQRRHVHRRSRSGARHSRRALPARAQPLQLRPAGDLRQAHLAGHPADHTALAALVALTSIFHSHAERDQYFSPQFFALAQTSFDHNYAQASTATGIRRRIGWTTLKNGRQQMDVKADLHYEKQDFQTASSNQELIGSTLSEHTTETCRASWSSPNRQRSARLEQLQPYSANALLGLVMPVFKRSASASPPPTTSSTTPPPASAKTASSSSPPRPTR